MCVCECVQKLDKCDSFVILLPFVCLNMFSRMIQYMTVSIIAMTSWM